MSHLIFIAVGIAAGFHAYSFGRWLKQEGNIPGSLLAFFLAASAAALPVVHVMIK